MIFNFIIIKYDDFFNIKKKNNEKPQVNNVAFLQQNPQGCFALRV